jgi:hypothetical protein
VKTERTYGEDITKSSDGRRRGKWDERGKGESRRQK